MQKQGVILSHVFFLVLTIVASVAQTKPRARDLGIPFDGTPGPLNAITDVRGVEVGHRTLISGGRTIESGGRTNPHGRDCGLSARERYRIRSSPHGLR